MIVIAPRHAPTRWQGRPRTRDPARPNATPTPKAVLDNMAKLKALRLAREAAEPQRAPAAKAAKKAPAGTKRSNEKPVALSDWLASQQNGGRRT